MTDTTAISYEGMVCKASNGQAYDGPWLSMDLGQPWFVSYVKAFAP